MRNFQLFIKRAFDIVASLILIVMLTVIPVFIVIPIAICATSKGGPIFKQERMGKGGQRFWIYKFRTMYVLPKDVRNENGVLIKPNGEIIKDAGSRITKVGKFLRKTSLDELMQLFNILNGTMSFVGPRPTLPYQAERYNEEQRRRFEMRPGVTGLAQVSGRNNLTWTEKIQYDIEYIDNFSLWQDIKILFRTVGVVLKKEDIEFKKEDSLTKPKEPTAEKNEDKNDAEK